MQTARTVAQARALFGASPRPLGFVPTMGALHAGHLELVRRARQTCAAVAVSIFVNPLQFGPNEDLAAYPRDESGDRRKLADAGVDTLFVPDAAEMYHPDFTSYVDIGPLGEILEGAVRPHHFRGVATVMAKLLNIVRPDALFLGQKDAQQAAILRKMIFDLNVPVELETVPTVRERDGLAMSSRNGYLDAQRRAQAPTLYRALLATRDALSGGASKPDAIAAGAAVLSPAARLDYLEVVDATTFAPLEPPRSPALIVGAARFGSTRLIDNVAWE
ncbi:MAG: pantoate--beta-alanine ligase [Candidatus Eremiobacteraeota bacterium]|nr:pantoate--beta-alanine ligase [Candidatus Eremiobacteraeota bacterium]MBV8499137.1 pantoate--beta-alanine ligase [Candidatus Eremiobacteraeota bacterium]